MFDLAVLFIRCEQHTDVALAFLTRENSIQAYALKQQTKREALLPKYQSHVEEYEGVTGPSTGSSTESTITAATSGDGDDALACALGTPN